MQIQETGHFERIREATAQEPNSPLPSCRLDLHHRYLWRIFRVSMGGYTRYITNITYLWHLTGDTGRFTNSTRISRILRSVPLQSCATFLRMASRARP